MRQIRYFLALAEELNFTKAAAKCNVSQPSLSRAIGLLESELGGALFHRERNLTHLTELGRRILPSLASLIDNADDALRLAQSIRAKQVGTLDLGLPPDVPFHPFSFHLDALSRTFSDLQLTVHRGPLPDLLESLQRGDVDVLLCGKPPDAWDRCKFWPLYHCGFSLVMRNELPLAAQPEIPLAALHDACLLDRPHCAQSRQLHESLSNAGVMLRQAPQFHSDADVMSYLGASDAIAYLPTGVQLGDSLTRRPLADLPGGYDMHAVTVAGRIHSGVLTVLLTQLRAADWDAALTA